MPSKILNDTFIKTALVCPPGKNRIEYTDASRSGMYVEVRATAPGEGTYYQRIRDANGKTRHIKLGRTTDISLAQAKAKAVKVRAQVQLGGDPQAEARKRRETITWLRFFEDRYLPHIKKHKRSWKYDQQMHRLRINPRFGHLRLTEITKQAVQQFHAELTDDGLAPATADHYIKMMRCALNYAVDWELISNNPIARVKQFNADNQVERYLSPQELQRLMSVLEKDKNKVVCNVILFLLATGARLNEALTARWRDIDQDNRVFVVPASRSKSKKKRSIPLNDVALEVLDKLTTKGRYDHLFISPRTKKPLQNIGKVWQRIRKDAQLDGFRIHDLRHSHASMLVNAGRTLYEVQQILGHSDPSVTQRYAHLTKDRLQEAANTASDQITAALKSNN